MAPVLRVNELEKVYRRRGKSFAAVNGISFEVAAGTVVGLLGPNGAGKTTTIKSSLGLIRPSGGSVTICGHDVHRQPKHALREVGAVLEGSRNIFWQMSPLENLLLFGNLVGLPTGEARRRALELLERFGLQDKIHTRSAELSRGMQQKVSICAALIRDPKLLLLDEPTLGLDVETAAQLKETLHQLAYEEGRAVVLSSHQMELVEQMCERVIIIQQGRIVADEQVERLLSVFATRAYRFRLEQPLSAAAVAELTDRFASVEIGGSNGRGHGGGNGRGIDDVPENGNSVAITFEAAEQFYDAVDILRADGALIQAIEHLTPDLEQVFLRVIREEAKVS